MLRSCLPFRQVSSSSTPQAYTARSTRIASAPSRRSRSHASGPQDTHSRRQALPWSPPAVHISPVRSPSPPLGNLRSMLSHHRLLAYRINRDRLREDRGAPPIWLDSHQSVGPASWSRRTQPLRQRVRALRSLWDLRWHGENRAVAARAVDPQVSACPICRRHWDQA